MEALILETKPDMIFISEANLRYNTPASQKDIQGYYIVTPNTEINMGYSRIILLVREGVQLTILNNCMDDNIPAIWVKLTSKGKKTLTIGGIYREFHHLLQPLPNLTDDRQLQINRWKTTISSWRRAARNGKCILVGDLNLDYKKWNSQDYRLKNLVQIMKDDIESEGFQQLVEEVTRSWPGVPSSTLDHIWTNTQESIMSIKNTVRAYSDHNTLTIFLRTKDRREPGQDIQRRDRKNWNTERYLDKIKNIDWGNFYMSSDVNTLNSIFEEKVGTILEEEAPLKWYQARIFFKNWLTEDLKNEMQDRDEKREIARKSGDKNNWKLYKKKQKSVFNFFLKSKINITMTFLELMKKSTTQKVFIILPGNS